MPSDIEPTIEDKACAYKIFDKWSKRHPYLRIHQQAFIDEMAQGIAEYVAACHTEIRTLEERVESMGYEMMEMSERD